jgi:PHD/YefM family antitoxin component YafN of YafNO toxin-antitoxin module
VFAIIFSGKERFMSQKIQPQYLINEAGQKTAVVIPLEEYEEMLEDLHDLAMIAERKDEPTISMKELKERLKADGLLRY